MQFGWQVKLLQSNLGTIEGYLTVAINLNEVYGSQCFLNKCVAEEQHGLNPRGRKALQEQR